jgi:hypothetical protein
MSQRLYFDCRILIHKCDKVRPSNSYGRRGSAPLNLHSTCTIVVTIYIDIKGLVASSKDENFPKFVKNRVWHFTKIVFIYIEP